MIDCCQKAGARGGRAARAGAGWREAGSDERFDPIVAVWGRQHFVCVCAVTVAMCDGDTKQ